MAVLNKRPGARIFFSIGRRGEQPDVYPARLASAPAVSFTPRGPIETATIITEQTNLAGEKFLGERVADLRYAWDRTETNERLDGSAEEPKTIQALMAERMEELAKFRQSQVQSVDVTELA